VDFPVRPPDEKKESKRRRSRPKEIYADLQAALARFKLIPPQPCANEFILDYIAQRSLQKVTGGWTWKFDEKVFDEFERGDLSKDLMKLSRRTAVIYGEQSALFSPGTIAHMENLVRGRTPIIAMPDAHHHLFLDQPLAFVTLLRALLAEWRLGTR
jgi:pimeloyl-ACP methyl ester carboxylesterase